MDTFKQGFKAFQQSSSGYAAYIGDQYVESVQTEIDKLTDNINKFQNSKVGVDQLKGNIFEWWHSGTANINGAAGGDKNRFYVPDSKEFASPDIIDSNGNRWSGKNYYNGAASSKEQAESLFERYMKYVSKNPETSFEDFLQERGINFKDVLKHDPIYAGQGRLIPKDQMEEAIVFLKEKIAKVAVTRPELLEKYLDTLEHLTDRIKTGKGTESIPITELESRLITVAGKQGSFDPEEFGLTLNNIIEANNIISQSLKAGLTTATISVILKIAPDLIEIFNQLLSDGYINPDSLYKFGADAFNGATEGFIKGSIAHGLTSACLAGQLGASLMNIDPMIIGAFTIITYNVFKNTMKLTNKAITRNEFIDYCMRDVMLISFSTSFGFAFQSIIVPFPGFAYLLGSFVGSIIASYLYDNLKNIFLSYSIKSGFTFFGLVEQNYTLPDEILKEIGVAIVEPITIEPITIEPITIEPITIEPITIEPIKINTYFLRRGVIGVNKIGYLVT